jgi:hypothetical protein
LSSTTSADSKSTDLNGIWKCTQGNCEQVPYIGISLLNLEIAIYQYTEIGCIKFDRVSCKINNCKLQNLEQFTSTAFEVQFETPSQLLISDSWWPQAAKNKNGNSIFRRVRQSPVSCGDFSGLLDKAGLLK